MQQIRRTLSIRAPEPEPVLEPEEVVRRAIDRKVCIRAIYNRATVMTTIRRATPDDAAMLAELKLATFRETFLAGGFAIPYPPADLAGC